jgi:O-antigen/teichoic acid export membrane protein
LQKRYILIAATNALGRTDRVLWLSVASAVLRIPGVLLAAQFNEVAIATTVAVISLLSVPMFMVSVNRLFTRRWLRLFRGVWVPALATTPMTATVHLISPQLLGMSPVTALACQVLVGVVTYAVAIGLMAPEMYRKMARLFLRPT